MVATLPLLLPLRGIFRNESRNLTWGAYLVLLYFVVGVMETWSNPAQRPAAAIQVVLCCIYLVGFVRFIRRSTRTGRD